MSWFEMYIERERVRERERERERKSKRERESREAFDLEFVKGMQTFNRT